MNEEPTRRGGIGRTTFVWLIAIVLLVATVCAGAYAFSSSSQLQGLTAGLLSQPTATPLPTPRPVVNATPAPATTAAKPPESSTPDPTSPAALFVAFVADPTSSYHLETTATARQGSEKIRIVMSMDQSGKDVAATMKIAATGRHIAVKLVLKDGRAYAKVGSKPWVATSNLSGFNMPSGGFGFGNIRLDKIDDLGRDTRAGQSLQHLRVYTQASSVVDNMTLSQMGCPTSDLPWDVWVRADGTPVSARFDYSCGKGASTLTASSTYEFTRVGQAIDITAPKDYVSR